MSVVVVGDAPWCACQPGCTQRAVGIVKTPTRAANGCAKHGEAAAKRLGATWTLVPRWTR